MIIVDERNLINKSLKNQGLHLFDFYDDSQIYSIEEFSQLTLGRRADILLVDTFSLLKYPQLIESIKPQFNTFHGVIFFFEEPDTKSHHWIQEQANMIPKILGSCCLPMTELHWTIFSNQLNFFWTMVQEQKLLQKHMREFSQELDAVMQTAEWEMNKAKKVHEALVPKRHDEIKGIHFYSKYATGNGSCGEFFDLHHVGNKVYQILVSSESYLISSSLLGLLEKKKSADFSVENFINEAKADIDLINSSKKKKSRADILVLELDLSNLTLRSYGDHKAELYGRKGLIEIQNDQDYYQIEKGEKIIVFSSGFIFNWNESSQKENVNSFIRNHQKLKCEDLITEFFYQIKSGKNGQFLSKDATIAMMEVNRYGMHQV